MFSIEGSVTFLYMQVRVQDLDTGDQGSDPEFVLLVLGKIALYG